MDIATGPYFEGGIMIQVDFLDPPDIDDKAIKSAYLLRGALAQARDMGIKEGALRRFMRASKRDFYKWKHGMAPLPLSSLIRLGEFALKPLAILSDNERAEREEADTATRARYLRSHLLQASRKHGLPPSRTAEYLGCSLWHVNQWASQKLRMPADMWTALRSLGGKPLKMLPQLEMQAHSARRRAAVSLRAFVLNQAAIYRVPKARIRAYLGVNACIFRRWEKGAEDIPAEVSIKLKRLILGIENIT